MPAIRGPTVTRLRTTLRKSAPARLVGRGRFRGFARVIGKRVGRKLSGLTKRIADRMHSGADLPSITRKRVERPRGTWKGKQGGRRRGIAIDQQVSSIANGRKPRRSLFRLTKVTLTALKAEGLRLVCGQLPVASDADNSGSAVDVVGVRDGPNGAELVLVELKTGYDRGRLLPAMREGVAQSMRGPLYRASDCLCHRHLAQLAATTALFLADPRMPERLEALNVQSVTSLLLYVTDDDVEFIPLGEWWVKKGADIVRACSY